MPEMRAVIQHQDGHDLAVSQPRLWSALLGRLRALPQQQCLPVRAKCLAKIIELTEVLHEPVEHGRLPTSDGADSRRGIQGDKRLASPQTRNSGCVTEGLLQWAVDTACRPHHQSRAE